VVGCWCRFAEALLLTVACSGPYCGVSKAGFKRVRRSHTLPGGELIPVEWVPRLFCCWWHRGDPLRGLPILGSYHTAQLLPLGLLQVSGSGKDAAQRAYRLRYHIAELFIIASVSLVCKLFMHTDLGFRRVGCTMPFRHSGNNTLVRSSFRAKDKTRAQPIDEDR